MLIRPISDLHIDIARFDLPHLESDKESILSIAGDLCEMGAGYMPWDIWLRKVAERFKEVVFVLGNHESYGGSFGKAEEHLREIAKTTPNLQVLNNQVLERGNVLIAGTTLWTDCDRGNPMTFWRLRRSMADFTHIHGFSPEQSYERNREACLFLRDIQKGDRKLVVVTHHSPSRLSEDPKYKDSPIAGGFTSDLDELVYDVGACLWHHGHVHYFSDYSLFGTRMICNPRGYESSSSYREDTGFKNDLVIQV